MGTHAILTPRSGTGYPKARRDSSRRNYTLVVPADTLKVREDSDQGRLIVSLYCSLQARHGGSETGVVCLLQQSKHVARRGWGDCFSCGRNGRVVEVAGECVAYSQVSLCRKRVVGVDTRGTRGTRRTRTARQDTDGHEKRGNNTTLHHSGSILPAGRPTEGAL
jgi:hypothetical protein